jgi:hypothetical protein
MLKHFWMLSVTIKFHQKCKVILDSIRKRGAFVENVRNIDKKIRLSYAGVMVVAIVLGIAKIEIAPRFAEASNEKAI